MDHHLSGGIQHARKREKIHDELQLGAQAICLEEMTGQVITKGSIYPPMVRGAGAKLRLRKNARQVEETVNAIRA